MNKILFVLGRYTENISQNGICIKKIKQELENKGLLVQLLCLDERIDGSELPKKVTDDIYAVNKVYYPGRIKERIRKIGKLLNVPVESIDLVKKLVNSINILNKKNKYDAIIAVVNPPEAAEAVYRYKMQHNEIKCIMYEIDPASNRYKNPYSIFEHYIVNKSIKWERRVYNGFDYIIHMNSHKEHYMNKTYDSYKEKFIYLDIPRFEIINQNSKEVAHIEDGRIRMLYAGAFYSKLREPYYMIECLERVSKEHKIDVDIFTGESMRQEILKRIESFDFMHIYSLIPQEKLDSIINSYDYLLDVGNCNSDFLPSKTLYYIGTKMKIIHFSPDDNDVSAKYYAIYPNALLVDERKPVEQSAVRIMSRVSKKEYTSIEDCVLLKQFKMNTPVYTANKILGLL